MMNELVIFLGMCLLILGSLERYNERSLSRKDRRRLRRGSRRLHDKSGSRVIVVQEER
jgi:hypothetical protein